MQTLERAQSELAITERRLAAIPQGEQVADLLAQLQAHSSALALAEAELGKETETYKDAQAHKAHLDIRVAVATESLRKEFGGLAHDAKSMDASQRAREVLALFKDRLLASKAHWLSNMITGEFAGLMRKRKLVSRVQVHPDTYVVTCYCRAQRPNSRAKGSIPSGGRYSSSPVGQAPPPSAGPAVLCQDFTPSNGAVDR
jgi:DNA sulfur modification protein DndD